MGRFYYTGSPMRQHVVTLKRTRIEVPCTDRQDRPSRRWAPAYYVVTPQEHTQYPALPRAEAYASARSQWPNCEIRIED